jgi:antitoxin ParD1/3/4
MPAMSTMNISLPPSLKEFVDRQVESGGYSTSSEYLRELIREARDREMLRGLIMEGLDSPLEGPVDDAFFSGLRARARGAKRVRRR